MPSESGLVDDDGDLRKNVALACSSSEELSAPDRSSAREKGTAPRRSSSPRGGTKLAQVVELLRQDRGAGIAELIVVTGLASAHDTRRADWAPRKRGFVTAIDRSDKERGSIYRVERSPAAEDSAAAHSGVAQTEVPPLSKKMRREAKRKARRAA